jgi:hypothetical protein
MPKILKICFFSNMAMLINIVRPKIKLIWSENNSSDICHIPRQNKINPTPVNKRINVRPMYVRDSANR